MMYLSRGGDRGRGMERGHGSPLPFGYATPAALVLGLGEVQRYAQPDRLEVSRQPDRGPSAPALRLQDPRTLDAGRVLDFGAPAPARVVEWAVYPYRPTEAPVQFQNVLPWGERTVVVT